MIDPEKKLAQWRKEKPHLAGQLQALFTHYNELYLETSWEIGFDSPNTWSHFIQPLLNALYANDPDVSFGSYMWGFSEGVEKLICEHPKFNILSFCFEIIGAKRPPVVPVFHKKPGDSQETESQARTVLPLRSPKGITETKVHQYYSLQIYSYLRCVALQIILNLLLQENIQNHPSIKRIGDIGSLKVLIHEMINKVARRLIEDSCFRGNLLMPLMDEMGCLFVLSRQNEIVTPAEQHFFKNLYGIAANEVNWIGRIVYQTAPILYQMAMFSPKNTSELSESLQRVMTDKKLLSDLLSYQAWVLTDILKTIHASDPARAEVTLQLLCTNLVELCPEQQHLFFETLIPIYLANKNYAVVRIEHDDVDAWLEQLEVVRRTALIRDGLYILTQSLQLHYKKGDCQQTLSTRKNIKQILDIASAFPEKLNIVKYASTALLERIERLVPAHKVIFQWVNALIEGSWLDDNCQIRIESIHMLGLIPLFEDTFVTALKLVLATIATEELQQPKENIIEQWSVYSQMSRIPGMQQGFQHKISTSLVYGWWDFLIYQHNFPACITAHFQQIFGDFTDCMLTSSENLQHALATIERLNTFSIARFPELMVYRQTRDCLVRRLFEECLIKPNLEKNRQFGLMAQILKNIADLDEKHVLILSKHLLLSSYFQDYLRTILAMDLDKHLDLWGIDPKFLRELIEKKIIKAGKNKFPPISAQTNDPVVAYAQAMLLLIMLVLVFRNYKEFDIFSNREGWQNWILSLFSQLHQKDRGTLLGKCLAELVIVSNVQQFIPERQQAKFRACLQINNRVQGKSIEDILAELALLEPSSGDQAQASREIPAVKKSKKRVKTTVAIQPPVVVPPPVIKKFPVRTRVAKPMPIPEVEVAVEEVIAPDKVSKLLQKSMQHVMQFIQKKSPVVMKLPSILRDIMSATEQALISLQQTLKFDQTVNFGADLASAQEADSPVPDQQKDYAIQWNRLLSQCSVALVNYCEQEERRGSFEYKECCEKTLALFNGYYFRDPAWYLPPEGYDLLQTMAACEELAGWDTYMTGGVCLDEDFLDIDLLLVRNASYISTEDIKQAIWPKVVSQLGIQSKKVFDDANCVQFEVKIPSTQGILKLDVTIYTQVSSESKIIQDTRKSLVSTGAIRWNLDGRLLMLPQTALAIFAKKPVLKVIVPHAMLVQTLIQERNKIGYACKHMYKYAHYRLDPTLPEALQTVSHASSTGVDPILLHTRLEEALTYLLDEKRFSPRPQATAHCILARYNLLALCYTSPMLNAEFHQACVAGFEHYFGIVLDNNPDRDAFTVEFTSIEFLAMYFFSGLLRYPSDAIQPLLTALMSWPTIGGVNTQDLLNILSFLPLDVFQCFWQQWQTQGFICQPHNAHPAIAATRILHYWQFPGMIPIQPMIGAGSIVRRSPESDTQSSSADSGVVMQASCRESPREHYGRFHQPVPDKVLHPPASDYVPSYLL